MPEPYYTLEELLAQRSNCILFGMNPAAIEYEISLVVQRETAESRRRHPSNYRSRPYDWDASDG